MYTLVFLICNAAGQCVQNAPDQVFQSEMQCEVVAQLVLNEVEKQVERGEMAPHRSTYQCVSWGIGS